MPEIPDSVKRQITKPQPDIDTFLAVVRGETTPRKVHLVELFADQEIMEWITEHVLEEGWAPPSDIRREQEKHLLCQIEYWRRMGYDYIRVVAGMSFAVEALDAGDTAILSKGQRKWSNEHGGLIGSWEDVETYPWPIVREEDLWPYYFVAEHLPEGMGILACPSGGFLEIATHLMGYQPLAMMSYDQPDLVAAVFAKTRECLVSLYRAIIDIPEIVGIFQGDDMGFKGGTLFSPDFLKTHVLPGHRDLAELAHARKKVYCLHSCGNLERIMDELIDDVGIDAKHSFEDVIMPIEQAYDAYGSRVALLGGLDVDILGRGSSEQVRHRAKAILNRCNGKGRFAFGSGNSLANYCRPENILAMFDEAYRWGK